MLVSRPAPMVVAVGATRPRFGAHLWLPPLKGHSAAAGGVAGGGDGKHARWCHARPAHSWACFLSGRGGRACHVGPAFTWCRCLERPEARAFVLRTTPRQARMGRPCGFQPCHLAEATKKGPGASGYGAVLN